LASRVDERDSEIVAECCGRQSGGSYQFVNGA
jgi:hypothetical protein